VRRHFTRLSVFLILTLEAATAMSADLKTVYEKSAGKATATYAEGMAFYRSLATSSPALRLFERGPTDSGKPLHVALFSPSGDFDPSSLHRKGIRILLINNAIHPGEPDGVEASMLWLRDVVMDKKASQHFAKLAVAIIPFYNIGGVLNRNNSTRVNQNGPESYGFRGNARNFDLNRDFIKADTRNARSFAEIYHWLDPDVFLDTHTSNGADYQHRLTILATQADQLGGALGAWLRSTFYAGLVKSFAARGEDPVPYVNAWQDTPDNGWTQFLDSPRYSTGYTSLFHSIGFMTETHMLKPFDQRMIATRRFIDSLVEQTIAHAEQIGRLRAQDRSHSREQKQWALDYAVDRSRHSEIPFHGYAAKFKPSAVSGKPRRYYDRSEPIDRKVAFYDFFKASLEVPSPAGYIVPAGWWQVIERLQENGVHMHRLGKDQALPVERYRITKVETSRHPFEGHYLHTGIELKRENEIGHFSADDWMVPLDQDANAYIVAVLEPQAVDSFFRWNFFDTVLQRKEHFSAYVFEDLAAKLLAADEKLKASFEADKAANSTLASDAHAQLEWLYAHSPHSEAAYMRYPVARLIEQR